MKKVIKTLINHYRCSLGFYKNKKIYNRKKNDKPAIFLMGGPEYNNLGDHAIAYATGEFIKRNFPDYEYYEIPEKYISFQLSKLKKIIRRDDLLLLQGGGNTGDIYPDQVKIRKLVINSFENEIILMPQTVHFINEIEMPKYYLENSNRITLVAREEKTFEMMKSIFPGRVLLTPDIVLSLKLEDYKKQSARNNISICLRNDAEKNKEIVSSYEILDLLNSVNQKCNLFSTVIESSVSMSDRKNELNKLFEIFFSSKFIITDRLHAMIISAITKTPCIVLPTFNHKVVGSYKWLSNFNFIKLNEKNSEIENSIEEIMNTVVNNAPNLDDCFIPLKEEISRKIGY